MTEADCTRVLALFGLKSLSDANAENWPSEWTSVRWVHELGEYADEKPFMPDFDRDAAAAVKLAEKMGERGLLRRLWPPDPSTFWHRRWVAVLSDQAPNLNHSGPTLGAALLKALEAASRA